MKDKLRKYLSKELMIEYKACLYFCCILFFYFVYLLSQKIYLASILYMFEMILAAYGVIYLQVYLFQNFDEAEQLTVRVVSYAVLCSGIYTFISYVLGWFDRNLVIELLFFGYEMLVYLSVYLFHKLKRKIDTQNLNHLLCEYKKGDRHE